MRLDKFLAHTGFGTRKEVKQLLKSKAVTVDMDVKVDPKYQVDPATQSIKVYDEEVSYKEYVYFMMNKPDGYLSATSDARYQTVTDLLHADDLKYEVFPAGRLDRDTEGLVLLTNDGQLSHEIISPKKDVFKTYLAHITGDLTEESRQALETGVEIFDGQDQKFVTKPARVNVLTKSDGHTEVEISITEGKFHQVKRMFASVGCKVIYLKRLSIGALTLDETLALGEYRELTEAELESLQTK